MPKSIFLALLFLSQLGAARPEDELPEGDSPNGPAEQKPGETPSPVPNPSPGPALTPPPEPREVEPPAAEPEASEAPPSPAFQQASDFVDTRVTFTFSNKNVFAGPGERLSQTSGYRVGVDSDYTIRFLENIHSNFSGYETVSRLVLYHKLPGYWPLWESDVALAALLLADTEVGRFSFFDSGTYVRLIRKMAEGKEEDVGSVDLTAWPVSADRFRLGYTYLISWGGTAIFPGKLQPTSFTEGAVPGVRLRWRAPQGKAYAFLGYKNALLLSRERDVTAGEQVPNHGVLAGAGVTIEDALRLEMNGGFFQKGTQERPGLEGNRIYAYGGSAAISFFQGSYIREASDLRLYRNDPMDPVDYHLYKPFKPGSGFFVSLEGSVIGQNLEDPDAYGSEKIVPALAGGFTGNLKLEELSLTFYAFFQSIDFLLFNVPGFVPFQAISEQADTTPEFSLSTKVEYALEALHMNPSLQLGVVFPATYTGAKLDDQGAAIDRPGVVHTQIVSQATVRTILETGSDATPVFAALLRVPFAFSPSTVLAAEVRFMVDDNQPRLAQDDEKGEATYDFDSPYLLGFDLKLQAKW